MPAGHSLHDPFSSHGQVTRLTKVTSVHDCAYAHVSGRSKSRYRVSSSENSSVRTQSGLCLLTTRLCIATHLATVYLQHGCALPLTSRLSTYNTAVHCHSPRDCSSHSTCSPAIISDWQDYSPLVKIMDVDFSHVTLVWEFAPLPLTYFRFHCVFRNTSLLLTTTHTPTKASTPQSVPSKQHCRAYQHALHSANSSACHHAATRLSRPVALCTSWQSAISTTQRQQWRLSVPL
jgi:hypothetical protein